MHTSINKLKSRCMKYLNNTTKKMDYIPDVGLKSKFRLEIIKRVGLYIRYQQVKKTRQSL